jgi:4-carboxymuconolactone decarboxylase
MDWGAAQSKDSSLSAEVRDVVILTTGVIWTAEYEIYAHTAVGLQAGLSAAAIEAIKNHRAPDDVSPAAIAADHFIDCLFRTHRTPADVDANALRALGEEGVVAAMQLAGRYVTASAMLNAFAVPVPDPK